MDPKRALQDQFSPTGICFGCGPTNAKGLRIKSFVRGKEVHAEFKPEEYHQAFPGMINGGIIGSLLDCHSNWAAAWYLMDQFKANEPPCTVTAYYNVKLLKPTASDKVLVLVATLVDLKPDRAKIRATLSVDGTVTAECEGLFVAVKPGHPAYNRW